MPITLRALLAPDRLALQFALKTVLSAGLAFWLAVRWELEQPTWAVMTAFIVAQPISGMVVQKGLARLCGTVVGTIMSVVFIALFAQTPWLFLLALAGWLCICTASSTLTRSAWAYSFVLSGYTVAIIALPAITHPLNVFDQAVARCTEISLGILCATVCSAVLWPLRVEKQLEVQARQAWSMGLETACATLKGDPQERKGLLQVLGRLVAFDAQREHAWFEGPLGRQRARAIGAMSQKLLVLLRIARAVRRQWRQLDSVQMQRVGPWLDEVHSSLPGEQRQTLVLLRQRLWDAASDEALDPAEHFCLGRLALMIDQVLAAMTARDSVEQGKAPAYLPAEGLASHRDVPLALIFGARSALAFLAMASFWMATAWTAASGGMLLTCVVCGLFASRENGAQIGLSFLRGIALAVPVAFVVSQLILPQWSGLPLLYMAMGVPLFFGALGMANPRIGGTATSFCLHFCIMVSPSNVMTFNTSTFLNNALAMVVGVSAAVLAFNLLNPRNPFWHALRLRAATLGDLVRLTRRDLRSAEAWFGGRMADRLLQLAQRRATLPEAEQARWDDGFTALDIGDELLHLRMCLAVAQAPLDDAQRRYLDALGAVLEKGPDARRVEALDGPSQAFIARLDAAPRSDALRLARGAVLQLQESWRRWCRRQEELYGPA